MPPLGTASIRVRAAGGSYPVWIGPGRLRQAGALLRRLRPGLRRLFVISSPRVWRLWGRELERGLRRGGVRAALLLMPDGEAAKRLATVERLAEQLVRAGADRGALLAAFGGGVVGDTVGFLAAAFMRGVDYVQVPTTLVAQLDSAIGGKTGVNLVAGKNLLGAFHQPRAVLADTRTLETLPTREFRAGLFEAVKCGAIADAGLFACLERRMPAVLARRAPAVREAVLRSVRVKARLVARDERDLGARQALNFGHTIGHALESLTAYRGLLHGEAVGWGMLAETQLAERLGFLRAGEARRIDRLIRAVGGLPKLPGLAPARAYAQLRADKKRRGPELVFALPRRIGRFTIVRGVSRDAVLACLRALRRHATG